MSLSFRRFFFPIVGALVLSTLSSALAKPSRTLVALRATTATNKGRHLSVKPKGGLMLGSTVVTGKEVFTLVDLNGGALANGDAVQVEYDSGKRPSYWGDSKGKVTRSGEKPGPSNVFKVKWKQKNKTVQLIAPSKKFVSGPGKGQEVTTVASPTDATTVFELVKNPKIAKSAPRKR